MQRALSHAKHRGTSERNDAEGQIGPRYVDVGFVLQILLCRGILI